MNIGTTVVVYGPRACGKTYNGEKLRAKYNLDRVLDEGTHRFLYQTIPNDGVLVLSEQPIMGYRNIPFAEAIEGLQITPCETDK